MVVYRKHSANPLNYMDYHYADEYSKFTQKRELKYAYNSNSSLPIAATYSVTYYIDGNEVDEQTFDEVMVKIQNDYEIRTNKICKFQRVEDGVGETTWNLNIGDDNVNWTDYLKEVENPALKVTFKNGTAIKVEKDTLSNVYEDVYYSDSGYANKLADELYHQWTTGINDEMLSALRKRYKDIIGTNNTKENKGMLTITNYKYDEKTATTTIWWSDKTQTSVTADNVSEATEFEGYCAACAKKLFGNKSTYLNQFDKWTVKIPARKKAEAEKKAAEDKAREEARAKRAAKKAERKAKRDIEIRAKQLADEYYAQEIEDEAEKIAHEKYGVLKNWFDGYSED